MFCGYSMWYISLLLAASVYDVPEIFNFVTILYIPSLTNYSFTEWDRFLIITSYTHCCQGWYVWISTILLLVGLLFVNILLQYCLLFSKHSFICLLFFQL